MVSFKETIFADGHVSSYVWSELPSSSTGVPPSLAKSVAFNVSESGGCDHQSSQKGDSVDGHSSRLKCEPVWDDDRYLAESDDAMNSTAEVASESPTSFCLLPFPVKMEENDDIAKIADDAKDLEIDSQLETKSDTGNSYDYKNPYSGDVHYYSSARCPRGTLKTRHHCLSSESQPLPESSKVSRKRAREQVSTQPLSYQSSPLSSCSKRRAKMKARLPAVKTAVQSSESEVTNMALFMAARHQLAGYTCCMFLFLVFLQFC